MLNAIVVWGNTIIDGHNRFKICTEHDIAYCTTLVDFDSRQDVIVWMLENQLGRRNLTDASRIQMTRRFESLVAAEARVRMKTGGQLGGLSNNDTKPMSISTQASTGTTRDKLASMARVGGTKFDQGVYVDDNAPEPIKSAWERDEIKTNGAYEATRALLNLPEGLRKKLIDLVAVGEVELQDVQWKAREALQKFVDSAQKEQRAEQAKSTEAPTDYIHGDCVELLPALPDNSIRLLLTDPPYSIGFQSNRRTATAQADMLNAIVVWGNTIIDGHNRFKICTEHDIAYRTTPMDFDSRQDVIVWMLKNQLARRNLTDIQRMDLAEQLAEVVAVKAKGRQVASAHQTNAKLDRTHDNTVFPKSEKPSEPINTTKVEASLAGVGHNKIAQWKKVKREAPPELVQKVRDGEMSVNRAYEQVAKKKQPVIFSSDSNEWYTPQRYIDAVRKVFYTSPHRKTIRSSVALSST